MFTAAEHRLNGQAAARYICNVNSLRHLQLGSSDCAGGRGTDLMVGPQVVNSQSIQDVLPAGESASQVPTPHGPAQITDPGARGANP
jgi:hypothetical protein